MFAPDLMETPKIVIGHTGGAVFDLPGGGLLPVVTRTGKHTHKCLGPR